MRPWHHHPEHSMKDRGQNWYILCRTSLNIIAALPVSIPVLMGFIAHLHNEGYAPPASTITKVSAISYFHKINGFQQDPVRMSSFLSY